MGGDFTSIAPGKGEQPGRDKKPLSRKGLNLQIGRRFAVALAPHGHQFLGGGGVQRDGAVKILFGGTHFQRHRDDLDNLGGMVAEHVAAQNLVGIRIHNQLHQGTHRPTAQRVQ